MRKLKVALVALTLIALLGVGVRKEILKARLVVAIVAIVIIAFIFISCINKCDNLASELTL